MKKLLVALLLLCSTASAATQGGWKNDVVKAMQSHDVKMVEVDYQSEKFAKYYAISFDAGAGLGYAAFKNDGAFTTFSGTAQHVNIATVNGGRLLITLGVTGTIIPAMEANGLDITSDASAANNDAVELIGGMYGASGRPLQVGKDTGTFCVTTKITDVSGTDGYWIGFREVEAPAAAITSYTDFAAIGVVSGAVKTLTDLNNAGESTTTLVATWADSASKTLCECLALDRSVTYTIDGSGDANAQAYSFASGLLVVPFAYLIQDSDIAEDTWISSWSVTP